MNLPTELKYLKTHEWLRLEGERGSRFYIGGCMAIFSVASMAALSCFLLFYIFYRKSLTGDVAIKYIEQKKTR